jgi:hypothetical protein
MIRLTERLMQYRCAAGTALWLIAGGLLGLTGVAQGQQADLTLSNANITAGSYIVLGPGFVATAGSASVTFQASIGAALAAVMIATNPAG